MKGDAYSFAKEVDRQIEALPLEDYLRRRGRGKVLRGDLYPISRLALLLKQPGIEIDVEAYEDDRAADGHIRERGFRDPADIRIWQPEGQHFLSNIDT